MYRRFFGSLRVRLMLVVLISAFPMLWLILHLCGKERACGISMARSDALQLTRGIARFQRHTIEGAQQRLIDLSHTSEILQRDNPQSGALLSRFQSSDGSYVSFAAVRPNGVVFASWPTTRTNYNMSQTFWYRRIIRFPHPLVSGYHFCPLSGKPVIIVARPVLDEAGAIKAILGTGLDLASLNHYLAQHQYLPGTTVTVTDRNGIVLAHYPYRDNLIGAPMHESLSLDTLRNGEEKVLDLPGADGVQRIYVFTSIGQAPDEEYVVVGVPRSYAYATARQDLVRSLGLLLAVMMLTLAGAWLVGDVFVLHRVRGVLSVMGQLADGDLSARSGVTTSCGELDQLACAFDQMADRLYLREMEARQLSEENLRRSEARIQLIIDRMPVACIVWDTESRVALWNASAEAVFGYTEAEALGKQPQELLLRKGVSVLGGNRWRKLLGGCSLPGLLSENWTKEGQRIICEWSSTPLEGPDGSVVAVVSMVQDVTERNRAEGLLHKLTQTLRMLSDCSQLLVRAQNEVELTEGICRLIVEVGGYRMAWVGYAEQDAARSVRPVSRWGYDEGYVDSLRLTWSDTPAGWGPAGTAIRIGTPVIVADIQTDPYFVYKAEAWERAYNSCIGLPLQADGRAFGVLLIYSAEADVFDTEESRLLVELADDLAYGIGALRTREEHRRASEALRESEVQFRKLYEEAPVAYQSLDEQGHICAVNRKWLEMFGYTREEVIGRWLGEFLSPSFVDGFRGRFERYKKAGDLHGINSQMVSKEGQLFTVEITTTKAFNEKEQSKRYHGVLRDVTDVQEAETAIQTLMESSVAITGSDYFQRIVRGLCEWLGAKCALVGEFVSESHVRVLALHADGGLDCSFEQNLFRTPCGTVCGEGYCVHVEGVREIFPHAEYLAHLNAEAYIGTALRDSKGDAIGVLAAISQRRLNLPRRAMDVMKILAAKTAAELERLRMEDERSKMERELRQAQKLQAIGTLAGGIAHDFNNILGIIYGYSEMSLLELPSGTLAQANLQNVIKATDRAKDLVRQILAFSRQSEQELKPLRLAPIAKEVMKLLRAALPSTIRIQGKIDSTQDIILGDPTQIHQVLMNLCTNAGQAMSNTGGLLEVTLAPIHVARENPNRPMDLEPGPYVQLTVRDTGMGMTDVVRERIFEPYFTTKQPGAGTGLGLAVVHGIVKASGGAIHVESQPGVGTAFTVLFPRLEGVISPERRRDTVVSGGEGTILLVDDEPALLDTVRQRLEYLGYRVISCSNGSEALEVFRRSPDEFCAVVTDQTMPQMTGIELAKAILDLRPRMPLILCTGYSEDVTVQQVQALGIADLLIKPLNLRELAAAVRRLVDSRSLS